MCVHSENGLQLYYSLTSRPLKYTDEEKSSRWEELWALYLLIYIVWKEKYPSVRMDKGI